MPKKHSSRTTPVDNALVSAAKTIGKAAGRVALVLTAVTHRSAAPEKNTRSQRSTKKTAARASRSTKTRQSKVASKAASTKPASSRKKTVRKKSS
jgi:hypothetical protein